jgi:hypothetical protein
MLAAAMIARAATIVSKMMPAGRLPGIGQLPDIWKLAVIR